MNFTSIFFFKVRLGQEGRGQSLGHQGQMTFIPAQEAATAHGEVPDTYRAGASHMGSTRAPCDPHRRQAGTLTLRPCCLGILWEKYFLRGSASLAVTGIHHLAPAHPYSHSHL